MQGVDACNFGHAPRAGQRPDVVDAPQYQLAVNGVRVMEGPSRHVAAHLFRSETSGWTRGAGRGALLDVLSRGRSQNGVVM